MDNIKALTVIDADHNSVFVQQALRFYAKVLTGQNPAVVLPKELQDRFKTISEEYLAWESRELQKELDDLDTQQQEAFRKSFFLPDVAGPSEQDIDWEAIEQKAMTELENGD